MLHFRLPFFFINTGTTENITSTMFTLIDGALFCVCYGCWKDILRIFSLYRTFTLIDDIVFTLWLLKRHLKNVIICTIFTLIDDIVLCTLWLLKRHLKNVVITVPCLHWFMTSCCYIVDVEKTSNYDAIQLKIWIIW